MAVAADIPSKFDCVINGEGYRLLDPIESARIFGASRAIYSFSPTFVQRNNAQGDYGDNQQDFWLTWTQRDWTLGEMSRHYRSDEERSRRYWQGANIVHREPGSVELAYASSTAAPGVTLYGHASTQNDLYVTSATNLYSVSIAGALSDLGVHGAGTISAPLPLAGDFNNIYITGNAGVRKYNGSVFSTFSATFSNYIVYHLNTLYGFRTATQDFGRYDTAGNFTSIYTWKSADNSVNSNYGIWFFPYGGRLAIAKQEPNENIGLYLYDGTGVAKIAELPPGFVGHTACEFAGMICVGGSFSANGQYRNAIFYWRNGELGILWQQPTYQTTESQLPIATFRDALVWYERSSGRLLRYDAESGAISCFSSPGTNSNWLASVQDFLYAYRPATSNTAGVFGSDNNFAATGSITHSLVDFDSSLKKYFRSVTIDALIGGTASVDIYYRVGDVDGSYTLLQAAAVSGTEYFINQSGRSISIKLVLNKSTISSPAIRRIYVRAVPVLQTYDLREFILDLSGRNGEQMIKLRDNSRHNKDGQTMAEDLRTAAISETPITIIDRFGSITGIIEADQLEIREVRPEEYVARVRVREV